MNGYYCQECKVDESSPCLHIEEALYQDELLREAIEGENDLET